jgi:hypothetical protein
MLPSLLDSEPGAESIRAVFARAARLALAGLLAAPAVLSLASAAGHPLRTAVGPASWLSALAGFGGAGWYAGRALRLGRQREAGLAAEFLAAGLLLTPAVRELGGLTGRESLVTVTAATLAAFGLAFALLGVLAARSLGITPLGARGVAACAAGGLAGGAFAMLPFCWALLRLAAPGESFLVVALAIVGFLGCLIAPFQITGLVLDRARDLAGQRGESGST